VYNPANCQSVELYFRGEKMAKVLNIFLNISRFSKGPVINYSGGGAGGNEKLDAKIPPPP
jgi:hypothetical protein